jgi:hypothetical protein
MREQISPVTECDEIISRSEMSTNKTAPITIENVLISLREMFVAQRKAIAAQALRNRTSSPPR